MKIKIILLSIILGISFTTQSTVHAEDEATDSSREIAATKKRKKTKRESSAKTRPSSSRRTEKKPEAVSQSRPKVTPAADGKDLAQALQLAKNGDYIEASKRLFYLSRSSLYTEKRGQIKYILGLMLMEMKLYQAAAFQFVDVIRSGDTRYVDQSLEKLSVAADYLENNTMLNYAISKVKVGDFPRAHRDMLYFRIGEYKMRNKLYEEAADSFAKVESSSPLHIKAKYNQGLALAEAAQAGKANAERQRELNRRAIEVFESIIQGTAGGDVTDVNRVAAYMGKARVFYQMQRFDEALESYREIPRDTEMWHDTLFESSWAMLRTGKFRSALSNFHSLHSPYYEDFYIPESLLLRSIVYLYICRYDEMESTLDLFEKIYLPIRRDVVNFSKSQADPMVIYSEMERVTKDFDRIREKKVSRSGYNIPFLVARQIMKAPDFQRTYAYIQKLQKERTTAMALPEHWRSSGIGKYSFKILETRLNNSKKIGGKQIRAHIAQFRTDLRDLFEQNGFLRYEMLNGQKESLKKKIAGKGLSRDTVDKDLSRSYFIQNGFEYWPFQGEYWLDEIGNYHYVGMQACE